VGPVFLEKNAQIFLCITTFSVNLLIGFICCNISEFKYATKKIFGSKLSNQNINKN